MVTASKGVTGLCSCKRGSLGICYTVLETAISIIQMSAKKHLHRPPKELYGKTRSGASILLSHS